MSDWISHVNKRPASAWASSPAARKLSRLAHLSDDDLKLLGNLKSRTLAAGEMLSAQEATDQAWILVSGWCARVPSADESTLQIASLMLPGDGFGFACTPWAGDNLPVRSITQSVIVDAALVKHAIRVRSPAHVRLSEACQRAEWLDQSYLLNHMTRLGRRNLHARVAHFLMEIYSRLGDVGLVNNESFDLPLTQRVLAEMLCLSGVHFNRITRSMKHDCLVEFPRGSVQVRDARRLAAIAEFTPLRTPFVTKLFATT